MLGQAVNYALASATLCELALNSRVRRVCAEQVNSSVKSRVSSDFMLHFLSVN